jgi:hypothetical protein
VDQNRPREGIHQISNVLGHSSGVHRPRYLGIGDRAEGQGIASENPILSKRALDVTR